MNIAEAPSNLEFDLLSEGNHFSYRIPFQECQSEMPISTKDFQQMTEEEFLDDIFQAVKAKRQKSTAHNKAKHTQVDIEFNEQESQHDSLFYLTTLDSCLEINIHDAENTMQHEIGYFDVSSQMQMQYESVVIQDKCEHSYKAALSLVEFDRVDQEVYFESKPSLMEEGSFAQIDTVCSTSQKNLESVFLSENGNCQDIEFSASPCQVEYSISLSNIEGAFEFVESSISSQFHIPHVVGETDSFIEKSVDEVYSQFSVTASFVEVDSFLQKDMNATFSQKGTEIIPINEIASEEIILVSPLGVQYLERQVLAEDGSFMDISTSEIGTQNIAAAKLTDFTSELQITCDDKPIGHIPKTHSFIVQQSGIMPFLEIASELQFDTHNQKIDCQPSPLQIHEISAFHQIQADESANYIVPTMNIAEAPSNLEFDLLSEGNHFNYRIPFHECQSEMPISTKDIQQMTEEEFLDDIFQAVKAKRQKSTAHNKAKHTQVDIKFNEQESQHDSLFYLTTLDSCLEVNIYDAENTMHQEIGYFDVSSQMQMQYESVVIQEKCEHSYKAALSLVEFDRVDQGVHFQSKPSLMEEGSFAQIDTICNTSQKNLDSLFLSENGNCQDIEFSASPCQVEHSISLSNIEGAFEFVESSNSSQFHPAQAIGESDSFMERSMDESYSQFSVSASFVEVDSHSQKDMSENFCQKGREVIPVHEVASEVTILVSPLGVQYIAKYTLAEDNSFIDLTTKENGLQKTESVNLKDFVGQLQIVFEDLPIQEDKNLPYLCTDSSLYIDNDEKAISHIPETNSSQLQQTGIILLEEVVSQLQYDSQHQIVDCQPLPRQILEISAFNQILAVESANHFALALNIADTPSLLEFDLLSEGSNFTYRMPLDDCQSELPIFTKDFQQMTELEFLDDIFHEVKAKRQQSRAHSQAKHTQVDIEFCDEEVQNDTLPQLCSLESRLEICLQDVDNVMQLQLPYSDVSSQMQMTYSNVLSQEKRDLAFGEALSLLEFVQADQGVHFQSSLCMTEECSYVQLDTMTVSSHKNLESISLSENGNSQDIHGSDISCQVENSISLKVNEGSLTVSESATQSQFSKPCVLDDNNTFAESSVDHVWSQSVHTVSYAEMNSHFQRDHRDTFSQKDTPSHENGTQNMLPIVLTDFTSQLQIVTKDISIQGGKKGDMFMKDVELMTDIDFLDQIFHEVKVKRQRSEVHSAAKDTQTGDETKQDGVQCTMSLGLADNTANFALNGYDVSVGDEFLHSFNEISVQCYGHPNTSLDLLDHESHFECETEETILKECQRNGSRSTKQLPK